MFRLWIVLSAIGVPSLAVADYVQKQTFWNDLNKINIKICVDQESALPTHPDAIECGQQSGAMRTVFEQEHTTPASYWANALFWSFVADLALTALLVGVFFVVRWVWRGFSNGIEMHDPRV